MPRQPRQAPLRWRRLRQRLSPAPDETIADAFGDMEPEPPTPAPPPQATPARVSFALWDDGGLSIYDGDDLLQLPPADTARLARLLGVPGSPLHTQEQRA